jgi:predicted deacylase
MRELDMLEGLKAVNPEPIVSRMERYLTTGRGGILYPFVEAGDEVAEGEKLAEIRSLPGELLETISAPSRAVRLTMRTNSVGKSGDYFSLILLL